MSLIVVKSKLPAEKRIELVHVSLMRNTKFAFFAGLFMVGKTTVVDNPYLTAWTNGRDAGYSREFVDDGAVIEVRCGHEDAHCAGFG